MTRVRALASRRLCLVALAVAVSLLAACSSAAAAVSAPGWAIQVISQPTSFSTSACATGAQASGCSYEILVTNAGAAASSGTFTISDKLPAGLEVVQVEGEEWIVGSFGTRSLTCTEVPVQCTDEDAIPAGDELVEMTVTVKVAAGTPAGVLEPDEATVQGGHAPSRSASVPASVEAPQSFGFFGFGFEADSDAGLPEAQAGAHPYSVTAGFALNTIHGTGGYAPTTPVEDPRDAVVYLPLGLVGDPRALPQCPGWTLEEGAADCPAASRLGTVMINVSGDPQGTNYEDGNAVSALYNVAPQRGYPAEFGFRVLNKTVSLYASVVRMGGGYGLRVAAPGILVYSGIHLEDVSLTFFGDPAERDGASTPSQAYLTNPDDCAAGPLNARVEADSWADPGRWVSDETTVYPQLTGCEMLSFAPSIDFAPVTGQGGGSGEPPLVAVDQPTGFRFGLQVPQAPNVAPALATPDLKDATVTLPEGVSISPAAAQGLAGCQAQGPEGINIGTGEAGGGQGDLADPEALELGEDHPGGNSSSYDDGLWHIAPGHCPAQSKIGTVKVKTPLLEEELTGSVYLAQPAKCATDSSKWECSEEAVEKGEVFGLYLEVQAEGAGVIIKLPGSIEVGGYGQHSVEDGLKPGQLRTKFSEAPQLPFSELSLELNGGPRAPLASPQTCGTATTTSDLEPWSAPESGPDAMPSSAFVVTGCGSPAPFAPGFSAGTTQTLAGAFSPFTLTLSRRDGEQDLSGVAVRTPAGLLGRIAGVPECGEAQANAGTCGSESQIGTTTVASGSGSEPLYLTGRVYLTGPYGGGPFGLSIVVPAVAGPFNLGNVVVRASIAVNPHTAAITATSNPLPQIIDGVPTRLQMVNVTLDRPGFMFNPTDCEQQQVTGTISSAQGATESVSSQFAVAGCANLPFKPAFSVSTAAHASKADGASLTAKITYPSAPAGSNQASPDANLAAAKVDLPKQLPSRLTTLQKACVAAVFEANPANCPAASVVGHAKALTPVLPVPLEGPAYFVSHGGEAFPSLTMVLQGDGVTIDVVGTTFISNTSITSTTFKQLPDVPITSFELTLPAGPYSALTANVPAKDNYNLCGQTLKMPTAFTGQNGAVIHQTTAVAVEGCSTTLSIASHSIKKRTLTLTVYAPAAGKLKLNGKGLTTVTKTAKAREDITVKLSQKQAGKLRTKVHVTFTPSTGKLRNKQTKSLAVRFKK